MDLTPYISALREDLTTTAAAGDEATRRTAAMLAAALEPSVRLAIMNALSDLAAEVTAELEDHVVEVRLRGRDVQVAVTGTAAANEQHDETPPPPPTGDGDVSRITVRVFDELKSKAERAAAEQGVSLNSFIAQAVAGALHGKGKHGQWGAWTATGKSGGGKGGDSSRVHGWVRG